MKQRRLFIYILTKEDIYIDKLMHLIKIYFNTNYKHLNLIYILKKYIVDDMIDDVIHYGLDIFSKTVCEESDLLLYIGNGCIPSCKCVDVILFNEMSFVKKCLYMINKTPVNINIKIPNHLLINELKCIKANFDWMFNENIYLNYHRIIEYKMS